MKKAELKTGMVVRCRDGYKGLVLLDTPRGDLIAGKHLFLRLRDVEDDLTSPNFDGDDRNDIVAVYSPGYEYMVCQASWDAQGLIWEREEK